MNNIQEFNCSAGAILARLFESFPVRISLRGHQLCGLDGYQPEYSVGNFTGAYKSDTGDVVKPNEQQMKFHCDTIKWLVEFGYITGYVDDFGIEEATLAPLGLAMLCAEASEDSDVKRASWGAKMLKAFKDHATDELADFTGKVLASYSKQMISP